MFQRIIEEAPYLARCSDDKTATRIRPREYALNWPYMQINRSGMVAWLIFDLDHCNTLIWEQEDLPPPNLIVRSRNKKGTSHIFYAIPAVCTTENARSKPIRYMKAIYEAMSLRMQADLSYSGPVAKTPFHPWWETMELHSHIYDLDELSEYVDPVLRPLWAVSDIDACSSHSRHLNLFHKLRMFAYAIVNHERRLGSYETFVRRLDAYSMQLNNFITQGYVANLTFSQVKSIVKSVSRWTWDRYTGGGKSCRMGVMRLSTVHSLRERQRLAAKRTHRLRKETTESRVRAAYSRLIQQGHKPTKTAIASLANITRQTAAKYFHSLTTS